eukprot:TRINITY_DN8277_c0_g1_i6.p1 TRINITY_DN8277_c0_g1~~TRINITY_DN8277_c0_g1_i6.p1  ORF type:complete len:110 (-),score=8.02 TRINITY_DN8277_c0_g1_i6:1079-1408(-)
MGALYFNRNRELSFIRYGYFNSSEIDFLFCRDKNMVVSQVWCADLQERIFLLLLLPSLTHLSVFSPFYSRTNIFPFLSFSSFSFFFLFLIGICLLVFYSSIQQDFGMII